MTASTNPSRAAAAGWPWPRWIAHRGAGRLAPENTLAAFRAGAACGYRAFECDVQASAEGVAFLLHDETLERTTNGSGRACDRPWSELSRLDAGSWHGHRYAGEPPATLAAVAAFVLAGGFAIDLELKPAAGSERETGRIVAARAAALWQGQPTPPLLSSFSPEALAAARSEAPALPRALLLDRLGPGWAGRATALGCVAIVAHHRLFDAGLMRTLREYGWRALAYTVDDPAEAARLVALGVDGLITDAVDRFAPAAAETGMAALTSGSPR